MLEVLITLLRNDTRLVLLLETGQGAGEQRRVTALAHQLARGGHTPMAAPVNLALEEGSVEQRCLQLWAVLRTPAWWLASGPRTLRSAWCAVRNR